MFHLLVQTLRMSSLHIFNIILVIGNRSDILRASRIGQLVDIHHAVPCCNAGGAQVDDLAALERHTQTIGQVG